MVEKILSGLLTPGLTPGRTPDRAPSRAPVADRQQDQRNAEPAASRETSARLRGTDAPEYAAAVGRLDRLLRDDGADGPRKDARPRGFYLNIVV